MKINKLNKIKTNNYGFGHMEIILVVLVVAIIGVVGFTVFNNHKTSSSLKATAQAGGYTRLGSSHGIKTSACKTYNSAWGGFYAVKVLFTKKATTPAHNYQVFDQNGITYAISQVTNSNAYWAGTVAAVTINMSVVNKDKILYSDGWVNNTIVPPNGTMWGIDRITTCK